MQVENIDNIAKRFRMQRLGYIATGYTQEQEDAIYRGASKILTNKYGHIISEDEIYNRIIKKGHIYTVCKTGNTRGFLEKTTGNIGISYFLKNISENLLHELVHRMRI